MFVNIAVQPTTAIIRWQTKEKQVAKKHKHESEQAVVPVTQDANLPAQVQTFDESDIGAGMEGVTSDEVRVPFLYSLKSNSPQVEKPVGQGGVPGAKAGMIMNMGTGELFDVTKRGILFIPCYRDHNYVEFIPRNLGGGFVAVYAPDDPKILDLRKSQGKFGKLWTGTKRNEKGEALDGTEISETMYLYGIIVTANEGFEQHQKVLVPFTSTQIKKYQGFMGRMDSFKYADPRGQNRPPVTPPIWSHRWELGTMYEINKKGSYYGWKMSLWEKNDDGTEKVYRASFIPSANPLYQEAKKFHLMLKEGRAGADYATGQQESTEADNNPPM